MAPRYKPTRRQDGYHRITVPIEFHINQSFLIGVLLYEWGYYGKNEKSPGSTPRTYGNLMKILRIYLYRNGSQNPWATIQSATEDTYGEEAIAIMRRLAPEIT